MTDEQFDQMMRQALPPISVDDHLLGRTRKRMEERQMKRTMSKRILVAAALCVIMGAIAVGAVSQMRTGTILQTWNDGIKDYRKLDKIKKKLGFNCRVPRMLSDDLAFYSMSISEEKAIGEKAETLRVYKGLMVEYQGKAGDSVLMSITLKEDEEWGQERPLVIEGNAGEIGGIPVDVSITRYRLVPADYQPSEAEKALQEARELILSYGSDQIEDMTIGDATFLLDGVIYCITDLEEPSKGELMGMARAVIEGE
jgi:hypothetical protein